MGVSQRKRLERNYCKMPPCEARKVTTAVYSHFTFIGTANYGTQSIFQAFCSLLLASEVSLLCNRPMVYPMPKHEKCIEFRRLQFVRTCSPKRVAFDILFIDCFSGCVCVLSHAVVCVSPRASGD